MRVCLKVHTHLWHKYLFQMSEHLSTLAYLVHLKHDLRDRLSLEVITYRPNQELNPYYLVL
jgi:hypothetical protein